MSVELIKVPNQHAVAFVPKDRDEWLGLRAADVTASDIGSLFGLGGTSKFQLWMEKSKREVVSFEDNIRMFWGRKLERAIAEGICEEMGWKLIDQPVTYYRDPRFNIGATPDFFVECPKRGIGLLQIKNVDFLVFKSKWTPAKDGGEAPDYIEAQLQCELGVTGVTWGAIGALVAGNDHHVYIRDSYADVVAAMQEECRKFWQSIADNVEPPMNFEQDADFIIKLNSNSTEGKVVDMGDNLELMELVRQYQERQREEKNAQEAKDALKAQIFVLSGDAAKVIIGDMKLNVSTTKDSPGTLVTQEMVGTYVGGRKGYRQLRVGAVK